MFRKQRNIFQIFDQTWKFIQITRNNSFRATFAKKIIEEMKQTNKKTVIHCVATGVPENFQSQRDYLASFVENENVLDTIESEKLVTLFKNTCIEKRHFSNSTNYLGNLSMEETMRAYVKG